MKYAGPKWTAADMAKQKGETVVAAYIEGDPSTSWVDEDDL